MGVLPTCLSVHCEWAVLTESRGWWLPWSYRCLLDTMWMLESKPQSSGKTTCAFNHRNCLHPEIMEWFNTYKSKNAMPINGQVHDLLVTEKSFKKTQHSLMTKALERCRYEWDISQHNSCYTQRWMHLSTVIKDASLCYRWWLIQRPHNWPGCKKWEPVWNAQPRRKHLCCTFYSKGSGMTVEEAAGRL